MHEHELVHLGDLRPEHVEPRRRQALVLDVPADGHAFRAVLDRCLQHLDGQLRELQRHGRHTVDASRVGFGRLGERVVVMLTDGAGEPLILDVPPPEIVDADRLDVDPHLVHDGDAILDPRTLYALLERRALDDVRRDRHVPVAMDVDDARPAPADGDLAAPLREQFAAGVESGGGAGNRSDKMASIHDLSYEVIRSSLASVPPSIASFSVLFRNEALSTRSTVTGQLKGLSVP